MPLISENQALILLAAILVVAGLVAWWLESYQDYDKGRFHTFIAVLAGLGIFITFLFYYNLVLIQNQQQQLAAIQEISRLNDSVLNSILDAIKESADVIPNFVISITPLTNVVCCTTDKCGTPLDPNNAITCTAKMVLSYRIFAVWQDVIISKVFVKFKPQAYLANFLQRANSQQLFEQWTANRINFNASTQRLGDLLFEYGLPITIQTPEEYEKVVELLLQDPRYKQI